MKPCAIIGTLIGVLLFAAQTSADDKASPGTSAYLDGYTAGRALASFYQNDEKDDFIRGVLEGLNESSDRPESDAEIRDRKLAWFEDSSLSKKDQASYAAGYLNGTAYKGPESLYSPQLFTQGLLDSLQSFGEPYVGYQPGTSIVANYQRTRFYRMKREVADTIRANERAGKAFLANNALQPGIVQSESGMQYKIINPGHGMRPTPEDTVVVSLVGRKIDGEVFYDSQAAGSQTTTIGVNQTLKGWQEALVNMSVGAEWELFLPASLAYGNSGWQGVVQPGETLIYNLKLIEVISPDGSPDGN